MYNITILISYYVTLLWWWNYEHTRTRTYVHDSDRKIERVQSAPNTVSIRAIIQTLSLIEPATLHAISIWRTLRFTLYTLVWSCLGVLCCFRAFTSIYVYIIHCHSKRFTLRLDSFLLTSSAMLLSISLCHLTFSWLFVYGYRE